MADLDRRILSLLALVLPHRELAAPHLLGPLAQGGHGSQVKVGAEVPEHGARDSDQRAVGPFGAAPVNGAAGCGIDDDLVVARPDEPAGDVLNLLAGLYEEVAATGRYCHGDAVAGVACPDVEARVARASVDGEEVEVGVKAGEDGVEGAVPVEVRGRGGEEVRAAKMGGVLSVGRMLGEGLDDDGEAGEAKTGKGGHVRSPLPRTRSGRRR